MKSAQRRQQGRGFTLIELVITMAIVAILAAIAVPSYKKHIQKSNRAVAKTVLTQMISREEAFFADRKSYATTLSALGYPANTVYLDRDGTPQTSNNTDRIYQVEVCTAAMGCPVDPSATLVWIRAVPIQGQNSPAEGCGTLTVSTGGGRGQLGGTIPNCWKS